MASRVVTGTILAADLVAYPNSPISFSLEDNFTDLGVTYTKSVVNVIPDQTTGYFSVTLAVPTTPATAMYRIRLLDDDEAWIYLTSGPATDLATLWTLSGSPITQSALQTVIDAHEIDLAAHTDLFLNVPANGLAVGTSQLVVSGGNVGMGQAGITSSRLVINTTDETKAGLLIRHGGQSGEGFTHPANNQAALYVTGRHVSTPAGFSPDLANYYMNYQGDLSAITETLECVEIANRLDTVTVAPAQAVLGLEVVAGLGSGGGMGALIFPQFTGIFGDVNVPHAASGTITEAQSFQASIPSSVGGNTITTAVGFDAKTATLAGGTIGTAIGIRTIVPATGVNNYGLYIYGEVNGSTPFEVRGADGATGMIARFRRNNGTDSHLVVGALGNTHSVIASSLSLKFGTDQAGQDTGTVRMTIRAASGFVGIADENPGEMLDVAGNINCTGVYKVDDVQVIQARVVDARVNDAINAVAWDGTTAGVLESIRDALVTHGVIAAA